MIVLLKSVFIFSYRGSAEDVSGGLCCADLVVTVMTR